MATEVKEDLGHYCNRPMTAWGTWCLTAFGVALFGVLPLLIFYFAFLALWRTISLFASFIDQARLYLGDRCNDGLEIAGSALVFVPLVWWEVRDEITFFIKRRRPIRVSLKE